MVKTPSRTRKKLLHHRTRSMTVTLAEIPALAKDIAKRLAGGEVLALIGELGSGKTTFTQALAKELSVKQAVTSPTFIIMNRYPIRLPHQTSKRPPAYLYHLDLYRLQGPEDANTLGLEEIWGTPSTITVIEWADKIRTRLPKTSIIINFVRT